MTHRTRTTTRTRTELAQKKTETRIVIDTESGTSGLKEFGGFVTEAYNSSLYWPHVASEYARMRTSTPSIVMAARQFTAWARSIKPVINLPDDPTDDDKRYKDFRESDYENMEGGFGQYIETAIGRVPFDGWYSWNIVYGLREPDWKPPPYKDQQGKSWQDDWRSEADDGYIGIRRLSPRDNTSFWRWDFDGAKRMIGWFQHDPTGGREIRLDKKKLLHHTFGDPNNPEGNAGLQPCWRLEGLQRGFWTVLGIHSEHAAGYLKFEKTEKGDISQQTENLLKQAARYILTAQEGNVAVMPFGFTAELIDTSSPATGALLEVIKHLDILMLSVFGMQWMALNTLTGTGSYSAQTDVTQSGITAFNSMLDGFAAQWDTQVERKIYDYNKDQFPNLTKRPRFALSHLENAIPLQEVGNFFSAMKGFIPLGKEDVEAVRKMVSWMPDNNPNPEDVIVPAGEQAKPEPTPADGTLFDPNQIKTPVTPEQQAQAAASREVLAKALNFMSKR